MFAEFTGGAITSDADLVLLREADRQLGLLDAFDAAIPDPRNPWLITHPQRTLLAQRVFGVTCGCEDLNDHQTLRFGRPPPTILAVCGIGICRSPPTLCRLENRVTRALLLRMSAQLNTS